MSTFEELSANNPYRNQQYKKSGWQRFLSGLGFRTEADAWNENMSVQAAEYDAALAQKQFDTEYNDPKSQVARMRAAGLNPDIDPSTIDSGEVGSMGEDPSTPMQSTGEEGQLMNVANTIVSCFTSALGLVSSVQGIAKNHLSNTLLDLENSERISDYAQKMASTFIPSPEQIASGHEDEWYYNAFERARIFSRKNLPRKFRKKFESSVNNFLASAPAESAAYKTWYEKIQNEKNYFGGKHEFYSPSPDVMDTIYRHLGQAREQLTKLGMQKEGAEDVKDIQQAEYESGVLDTLNPAAEAGARNAEFVARKNQAEVTNILRGTVNGILNDLKKDNSEFGGLFRFLLSCYSLYMFSK